MSAKETVAIIDVGSNSIKMLIACKGAKGNAIESVYKETLETRISAGISQQNPTLTEASIEAGVQSIQKLVATARDYNSANIKIVTTSAVRDATNGTEFTQRVAETTGVPLTILSGIEEAAYIVKGLRCDPLISKMNRFIQMDIGGGSLELIDFNNGATQQACSLQLGAVRLTERFINDRTTAISKEAEAQIAHHVTAELSASGFEFGSAAIPMIGTGGALFIARAVINKTAQTQLSTLSKADVVKLQEQLGSLTLAERKSIPGLPTARADILPTGLITVRAVLDYADRDTLVCSSYNLRYGVAAELLSFSTAVTLQRVAE